MNQEGPQGDSSTDDDVVDGDYEVVDEDCLNSKLNL